MLAVANLDLYSSHPVECMLKLAHAEGKQFRVILVESAPKREAKTLMQKLVKEGIHCTLVLLNAVSYVMKEVHVHFQHPLFTMFALSRQVLC